MIYVIRGSIFHVNGKAPSDLCGKGLDISYYWEVVL